MKKLILKKGLIEYKFIRRYINIFIFIFILLSFIFIVNLINKSLNISKAVSLKLVIIFLCISFILAISQLILHFYNKKHPIFYKKINYKELFKHINKISGKDNVQIDSIVDKEIDQFLYDLKIYNEENYSIKNNKDKYIVGTFYTNIFNQHKYEANFLNINSNYHKRYQYIKFNNLQSLKVSKIIFNLNKLKNNFEFSNIYFANTKIATELQQKILKIVIETKSYPNIIIEKDYIYLFFQSSIIFKNDDNSGKLFNIVDCKNIKDTNNIIINNLNDIKLLIEWSEKINIK